MDVVILGCGYVGLAAGSRLLADGHAVTGVRRSEDGIQSIEAAGMKPLRGDLTDPEDISTLPDADWVLYTASVGRGGEQSARDIYVDGLASVIETYTARSDPPDRLIYTSSTGVYGDHGGAWVDETTPPEPGGTRGDLLLEAESIALKASDNTDIDGTVLRFGGLYGPGRYRIERYLNRPITDGYRNSTHRQDAAGAMVHLLDDDLARDEVVLVVDDEPVESTRFVRWLATQCDQQPPPVMTVEERLTDEDLSASARERVRSNKRCRNERLRSYDYELEVPTVWEGYEPAIDQYRGGRGSS